MNSKRLAPFLAALALAACNASGSSNVPGAPGQPFANSPSNVAPQWLVRGLAKPACPQFVGKPTCLALVGGSIDPAVAGLTPTDFQARYRLPSATRGARQIVAIVDAYDNPNVATDLAAYRSKFNLGAAKFHKYNQKGQQGNYPRGNKNWGVEIDLDVEMVSAVCPKCTIDLVEANNDNNGPLETAEAEAVKLGAHIVSNSWINYGSSGGVSESYFDTPGVVYLAGSGDYGYNINGPPEWFPSVVSVGGTVLTKNGSTWTETAWDGAGGGCSSNTGTSGEPKPSWQHDPDCTYRTDSDISAVACVCVAMYDTYGGYGWFQVGGTSVATPLTAAIFALAGNARSQNVAEKFWAFGRHHRNGNLHTIRGGSDGACGGEYLCLAGTHQFQTYSGPAGWGTPSGLGMY